MAMRETVTSMRAYFILTGLFGGLVNAGMLLGSHGNLFVLALGIIGALASMSFLYIGSLLPKLITTSSPLVPRVLLATGAYLVLLLVLGLLAGGPGVVTVLQAGIGLLITWYLLRNFRRLVTENTSSPAG